MKSKKWFELKSPFKVTSEIDITDDGKIIAMARIADIYDPLSILPEDATTRFSLGIAKCHPDDEYDCSYGVRLASNRARLKLYTYVANRVNEKLEQLDKYLCFIHNKIVKLREEHEQLLLEQMHIATLPEAVTEEA